MNFINKMSFVALAAAIGFASCEKEPALQVYKNGAAPTLSLSTTTVAAVAADSNKTVLTVNWSNPSYAMDSSKVKYVVQVDSAGRNFSKAVSREVIGALTTSFIAKDLNTIMLNYGFQFGKAYDLDVRLISSYGNNNERYFSNVVKIKGTPYKIPPKVALPASGKLFIVGSGTQGDWGNPVPTPTQEFTRIDETTFGGIFNLNGGGEYLILPTNGQWAKYSVANNSTPGIANGGDFGAELRDNFVVPNASGWYKIVLDFQTGKFTVTPFAQQHGIPSKLVIVGDGSPQGWNNSVDNPYVFTQSNAVEWSLVVTLTTGKEYLILPEPGNWGKKFGATVNTTEASKLGGTFKPEGDNFKTPGETASYKVSVNFIDNSYKVVKQ